MELECENCREALAVTLADGVPMCGRCRDEDKDGCDTNAIVYIQQRRDYFAAKDLRNGWSGRESGPCCERCELRDEHFTGRADFLRATAGCRNPFQLPEVCECHVPVRQAVRAGIVEAHDQLLRWLTGQGGASERNRA